MMGIKNGCKCIGHWRARRKNWRVTEDRVAKIDGEYKRSRYSEIQCRICRRQWRSAASHVDALPRHKKRQYEKLTEADVLTLIRAGHIHADKYGNIWKRKKLFNQWRPQFVKLAQVKDKCAHSGYLFVDIKHGGARKWCAVNRVVWMCKHRKPIPKGHDIDHRDRQRTNNAPDNLRALTKSENHPANQAKF